MAAGGDVQETVMTMPFLRACITNMIADQERKSISDSNKRRALPIPSPMEMVHKLRAWVPPGDGLK